MSIKDGMKEAYQDRISKSEEVQSRIEAHRFLHEDHEFGCSCESCKHLRSLLVLKHKLETESNEIIYAAITNH